MTTMDGFLVARCDTCDRTVLTARDLDSDGALVLACVHCDTALDDIPRPVDVDELDAMGYVVEGRLEPHGERGCRDGGCGVRQPDD